MTEERNNTQNQDRRDYPEASFKAIGFPEDENELSEEIKRMIEESKKIYESEFGIPAETPKEEIDKINSEAQNEQLPRRGL